MIYILWTHNATMRTICQKTWPKLIGLWSQSGFEPQLNRLTNNIAKPKFLFPHLWLRIKTPNLPSQGCRGLKIEVTKIVTNHCSLPFFLHPTTLAVSSFSKSNSQVPRRKGFPCGSWPLGCSVTSTPPVTAGIKGKYDAASSQGLHHRGSHTHPRTKSLLLSELSGPVLHWTSFAFAPFAVWAGRWSRDKTQGYIQAHPFAVLTPTHDFHSPIPWDKIQRGDSFLQTSSDTSGSHELDLVSLVCPVLSGVLGSK